MSKKYYVRGKQIDLDYWAIDLNEEFHRQNSSFLGRNRKCDIDEHDAENTEYVTDRHGRILGVAWEMEL